jgi:uncharacterized membrane-anchored protein
MKKITKVALALCYLLPTFAFAALGDGKLVENTNSRSLVDFLGSIQSWLLGIVGGLSVLFIVYGGFLYVTSSGNQQKVETAKKTLTYAILGLVLVVLAGLIFSVITGGFLTSIFGSKSL